MNGLPKSRGVLSLLTWLTTIVSWQSALLEHRDISLCRTIVTQPLLWA